MPLSQDRVLDFIFNTDYDSLPPDAQHELKRILLDASGVMLAAQATKASQTILRHAGKAYPADPTALPPYAPARLLYTGRPVSALGAALANGMSMDALDAHDGHKLTKGHPGAAVIPALFALWDSLGRRLDSPADTRDFLGCLAVGYEVAIRAGMALHASAPDYHTSGAWNCLGVVAMAARLLPLTPPQTWEALGIAEYHGPRSQMMRCIDYPSMVKDGSGMGAMTGISAAWMAFDGFTGAPAITISDPALSAIWGDLGQMWHLTQLYYKPWPICRWAQPAVQAVIDLAAAQAFDPQDIKAIEIATFHESLRLAGHAPQSEDEAQYAIAFPVAAYLIHGQLTAAQLAEPALNDARVLALAAKITLTERADFNAAFPQRRISQVTLSFQDGSKRSSRPTEAQGDPETPLSDTQLIDKFTALTASHLTAEQQAAVIQAVQLATSALPDLAPVQACLFQHVESRCGPGSRDHSTRRHNP